MVGSGKAVGSKTLDNGLKVLETVSEAHLGITLTELASHTELHATVVFRLLQTLESRRLVRRDSQKRYFPGPGLIPLAGSVDRDLKVLVEPVLRRLTEETQAASYLMVTASPVEVMAEVVIQPRNSSAYITFSSGSMHSINHGSGGIAILSGRSASPEDALEVLEARNEGVAVSAGQVLPNVIGVAAPLVLPDRVPEASIGVSILSDDNLQEIKKLVKDAAHSIKNKV